MMSRRNPNGREERAAFRLTKELRARIKAAAWESHLSESAMINEICEQHFQRPQAHSAAPDALVTVAMTDIYSPEEMAEWDRLMAPINDMIDQPFAVHSHLSMTDGEREEAHRIVDRLNATPL